MGLVATAVPPDRLRKEGLRVRLEQFLVEAFVVRPLSSNEVQRLLVWRGGFHVMCRRWPSLLVGPAVALKVRFCVPNTGKFVRYNLLTG